MNITYFSNGAFFKIRTVHSFLPEVQHDLCKYIQPHLYCYISGLQRYNLFLVQQFLSSTTTSLSTRGTVQLVHYTYTQPTSTTISLYSRGTVQLVPCTASPTPYYYIPVLVSCNMILVQTVLPPNTTSLSIKCTHVPCTTGPAPTATSLSSRATTCSLP
jgi:hypothetical protein